VLINLLTNGVKFTPRGGDVRVVATRDAKGIEIRVSDSGVGISARDL
jgi:cell cycle sensor histidine kinase DivJ